MAHFKKPSVKSIYDAPNDLKYGRKGSATKSISKKSPLKTGIEKWLGTESGYDNEISSDFDIINAGQKGITKGAIDNLAAHLGVNRKSMAEDILSLSVKTLERKDKNTLLDKRTSSHALEIAKVMQHSYAVFEDEEKVKFWINDPNKALEGKKPVDLFDTLTGLSMVNDILIRIEEGVYS